jgi:hypothetical protein
MFNFKSVALSLALTSILLGLNACGPIESQNQNANQSNTPDIEQEQPTIPLDNSSVEKFIKTKELTPKRKALFTKAKAEVEKQNKTPKFEEYYQMLDKYLTKIEAEKTPSQENIDFIENLSVEYVEVANQFNQELKKLMAN